MSTSSASESATVKYDPDRIYSILEGVVYDYSMIEKILTIFRLPCVRVYYEDLVDNPNLVVATATEALVGHAATPLMTSVPLKRQRDDLSRELLIKFLRDLKGITIETNGGKG